MYCQKKDLSYLSAGLIESEDYADAWGFYSAFFYQHRLEGVHVSVSRPEGIFWGELSGLVIDESPVGRLEFAWLAEWRAGDWFMCMEEKRHILFRKESYTIKVHENVVWCIRNAFNHFRFCTNDEILAFENVIPNN